MARPGARPPGAAPGAERAAPIQVEVTGLAAGGDGIGRMPDGRIVFCEGALPRERALVQVTEQHRDYARASVVEIVEPSPARVRPPCPEIARGCGGCTWLHVDPSLQASFKAEIVADALARIGHLPDVEVAPPPPGRTAVPARGYRTGVRLAVDADGRPAYRVRRGHDLVPVQSCLVAHPLLADLATSARFPGAGEVLLRVGAATGERLAAPDRAARGATVPADVRMAAAGRPPPAVHEDVAGRRWRVSAGSFFQSGPAAAAGLVEAVTQAAGADRPQGDGLVVDLYAGVGVLGGSLAAGSRLVSVESSPTAVGDAVVNLADLGGRVIHGEVLRACRSGDVVARGRNRPDLVLADPARSGLGPSVSAAVAALGAPVLVLVSCDPASLGRDARLLEGHGYHLERVEVLDLFPQTFHVEAVSRFVRTP
ncbi:MAG: class I SAM-dependent RNA methyltransferase [Acidimicrobiales bacterium]